MVVGEPSTPTPAVTGPAADVMMAAHVASEVAHKIIKPGAKNTDVTKAIVRVAEEFGVTPMHGVVSHRLKVRGGGGSEGAMRGRVDLQARRELIWLAPPQRFVIEGNEHIAMFVDPEVKSEEFEFEVNQVYAVDVMLSTGEGKVSSAGPRFRPPKGLPSPAPPARSPASARRARPCSSAPWSRATSSR